MTSDRGSEYSSPAAFRAALTARLKQLATASRWQLPQLQRQIAYDRLLVRLYLHDSGWIVKGAIALLARDLGVRATNDIDVFRRVARETAEAELRQAADRDIGDWFRFEIGPGTSAGDGSDAIRLPVTAYVGPTVWQKFHIDLASESLRVTGEPDEAPPLARLGMPGVEQLDYRVYPLVDHVADKIMATFQRYGQGQAPSTRYKDLVDLVAIVTAASVDAEPQRVALRSEAERRGIPYPQRFLVPDRTLWERGYRAEANRSFLPIARTLDEALAVVCAFADPVLDGMATGRWDPASREWSE
jgi:hypothetical protein